MGKIIIDNRSDLTELQALQLIGGVVRGGRVSNEGKQYCYLVTAQISGKKYAASSFLNKKSDRFVITEHPEPNKGRARTQK
ncbi:MAG: hypothetical protein U5N26_06890 [Candidatus Marinimicrobia bacterium]|nr:hypothetical protein [Candidatus Neomarinimicrobiota bacterium]